ncbi:Dph6-related ATP pyrophosphatase [Jeotgalibacillus aurantiacus]|uniref:Dph6-related ATP pyrophosphatase n=1 Tax=Jeotgalibacillus aurantiacus TaxID=2763266 RepID=UPI001D0B049C|nr:diphthine--ammonia ligase [Jeotgalibacillus aurantiacus]
MTRFFCSWSGGKDSALSFYKMLQQHHDPAFLLTMFEESEQRSRSHAMPMEVIQAQADAVGVPLIIRGASWGTYEAKFLEALEEMKSDDVHDGVFGDIDLEDHLKWVQDTCAKKSVTAHHPLWKLERRDVLNQLLEHGFECMIIAVQDSKLPDTFLGQTLSEDVIQQLESFGVDACGEEGEFHTVVVDAPMFSQRLSLVVNGIHRESGYSFAKVELVR